MKTYQKIEESPKLVISYDQGAQSPREWDNLGYFITVDSRYSSPDKNEEIEGIVKCEGDNATSTENHAKLIKEKINSLGEKVLAIYPVSKYEHSGVSYSLGESRGFDYSNNGFYIVTERSAKITGTKKKDFEKVIEKELEIYTQWANGENYRFLLYDNDGEFEDSGGGFYDVEDIREYLPAEWENEDLSQYIK